MRTLRRNGWSWVLAVAAGVAVVASCGPSASTCASDADCSGGLVCRSGACTTPSTGGGAGGGSGDAGIDAGAPDAGADAGTADAGDDAGVDAGLGLGQACVQGTECTSGFCVDRVCCDSACTGTCESCNLAGREGACDAVDAGLDPDDECTAADVATCGLDGTCDGARACRSYVAGTVCQAAMCSGGSSSSADTCDGAGVCVDNGTVACGAYACETATGQCFSSCTAPSECASGYTCAGTQCLRVQGAPCAGATECASGQCVDGVCCDAACSGACQACDVAGSVGTCANIPVGQDPADECAGSAACNGAGACAGVPGEACTANAQCLSGQCVDGVCCNTVCTGTCQACNVAGSVGTCTNIPAGQDPANECAGSAACDGAGACAGGPGDACTANAQCLNGQCVDGVCCSTLCTGTCQACNVAGSVGTCTNVPAGQDPANECAGNTTCNGLGGCTGAPGDACTANGQCLSSLCVDGVCCNTACTGTCQACNLAGSAGTCSNIPAGQDPANECAGNTACSGAGACASLPNGTACVSSAECGSGQCVDGVCCNTACAGLCLACNLAGSVGTCTNIPSGQDPANECAGTTVCSGASACVRANGDTCANGTQCASGICTDGVCCNTSCTGLCRACSAAKNGGSGGTCTNIPSGTDPDNECAGALTCNGAGACN